MDKKHKIINIGRQSIGIGPKKIAISKKLSRISSRKIIVCQIMCAKTCFSWMKTIKLMVALIINTSTGLWPQIVPLHFQKQTQFNHHHVHTYKKYLIVK